VTPRLRGLVVAAYTAASVVFFFLLQLPVMVVTLSGDFSIWLARRAWSPSALWLCGVTVEVRRSGALPAGPAIYVSNHESALDIWVIFRAVQRNLRFVAKHELFRIPIFGWYLSLARFVPVDRKNRAQAVAALKKGSRIVREGISLVAFPEGTRSVDGRVHAFKKGPFVLAMEAGVPVVPIAIVGTSAVTPKRRVEVHPGPVRVAIGEAVDPRHYADKVALLRDVRRRIIEQHRALGGDGGDADDAVAAVGREGAAG
jgi:1-acyl-sn-glycerol-3-phosphate acyltransferase